MLTKDDKVLTGSRWVQVIRSADSSTIRLFIRAKESTLDQELPRMERYYDLTRAASRGRRSPDYASPRESSRYAMAFHRRTDHTTREPVQDDYGISQCLEAIPTIDDAINNVSSGDGAPDLTSDTTAGADEGGQLILYGDAANSSG